MKLVIPFAAAALLLSVCTTPHAIAASSLDAAAPVPDSARSRAAAWTAYRAFDFDAASSEISAADAPKLGEIVAYAASDPSLDVGIDGSLGTEVSQVDRDLSARRAASVRRALMDTGAGIASYRIKMIGPFAEPGSTRTGRIQVWVGPRKGSPPLWPCAAMWVTASRSGDGAGCSVAALADSPSAAWRLPAFLLPHMSRRLVSPAR